MVKSTEWYQMEGLARLHKASLPLALQAAVGDNNRMPLSGTLHTSLHPAIKLSWVGRQLSSQDSDVHTYTQFAFNSEFQNQRRVL
jgi:hypothetical protein